VNPENNTTATDESIQPPTIDPRHLKRLKIAAVILTLLGVGLFAFFVYSVGPGDLLESITRFGVIGFAGLLVLYFLRIVVRALAWDLSVNSPYKLTLRDTIPAVVIGEAASSMIPLGILVSGTAKALAVRKRIPFVVALSSVATENLFYSLITSLFLIAGAFTLLRWFTIDEDIVVMFDLLIAGIIGLVIFLVLLVVRQWHLASELCEKLYQRGYAQNILGAWRMHIRLFENLIFSFYREHPRRFFPICGLELIYHLIGVTEVYYMLSRISDVAPNVLHSFLLESVSRLVTILFKLIPFVIGVDEAGSKFVGDAVALAAGVGVTLAILRKGRLLFWTFIGLIVALKRGLSLRELASFRPRDDSD